MKGKENDHSKYQLWCDPNTVIPYEKNAKIHTEKQIKNICTSISRFGWQQDTVLTSDNVLVIGHGRRLAAIKLGCEMPYHVIDKTADELTDEDIRELRIADNQTNAETGVDFTTLEQEISDLSFEGFDFDFGIETDGAEDIAITEDEAPEPPAEPKSKLGDLYQLGDHRLICGDSTDASTIKRLMGGLWQIWCLQTLRMGFRTQTKTIFSIALTSRSALSMLLRMTISRHRKCMIFGKLRSRIFTISRQIK